MSEGVNLRAALALLALGSGWYYYNHGIPSPQDMRYMVSRESAFEACKDVCQANNAIVIDALIQKGNLVDPSPFNALKNVINDICFSDCEKRIPVHE